MKSRQRNGTFFNLQPIDKAILIFVILVMMYFIAQLIRAFMNHRIAL